MNKWTLVSLKRQRTPNLRLIVHLDTLFEINTQAEIANCIIIKKGIKVNAI